MERSFHYPGFSRLLRLVFLFGLADKGRIVLDYRLGQQPRASAFPQRLSDGEVHSTAGGSSSQLSAQGPDATRSTLAIGRTLSRLQLLDSALPSGSGTSSLGLLLVNTVIPSTDE